MSMEMNNLKVLGLIKGVTEIEKDIDDFYDESKKEYNSILVEDAKNKAKYYININSVLNYNFIDLGEDVTLTIEPYREEKELTYLPKGDVYIEGFAINPETLDYSYVNPENEYPPEIDEYYETQIYREAEEEYHMEYGYDDGFIPNRSYDPLIELENELLREEAESLKADYINRYVAKRKRVDEYYDDDSCIKNNVFSCHLGNSYGFVEINEELFTPCPQLKEIVKRIKTKMHQRYKERDPLAQKAPGMTQYNKGLMMDRFLEGDEMLKKKTGDTEHNKKVMKLYAKHIRGKRRERTEIR